jgi:hypothetical protein
VTSLDQGLSSSEARSGKSLGTRLPFRNRKLGEKIESVQRRATGWILKPRLARCLTHNALGLLPLCYDREIKDLVFFFKALYGYINLNINDYVSFVDHGRSLVLSSKHLCVIPIHLNHRILTV